MKVEVAAVEGTEAKKDLIVEIPSEQVKSEFEKTSSEIARHAKVPGFRPGKAPIKIVKQKFAGEIKDEVRKQLMQSALHQAITDNDLHVIGHPKVDEVILKEGEPFILKVMVEIIPKFDLKEYKGIPLTKKTGTIKDTDIDESLKRLQDSYAESVPVEDRPSQDGDFVSVNLVGTFEEISKSEEAANDEVTNDESSEAKDEATPEEPRQVITENITVEIGGKDTIAEFSENLRGTNVGDTREFTIQYKDDYFEKDLAGQQVSFKIDVVSIQKKELPELNDDLAKLAGEFESLQDLREGLRKLMATHLEASLTEQLSIDAADTIMKEYDFEAPESMVNEYFKSAVNEVMHALQNGRLPQDFDFNAIIAKEKEAAKRNAMFTIVLGRIADKEHIHVTDDEVEAEIANMAAHNKMSYEQLKARLTKNDTVSSIAERLMYKKVLDFIVDNAQITVEELKTEN